MILLNVFFVIFSGLMMTSVQAVDDLGDVIVPASDEIPLLDLIPYDIPGMITHYFTETAGKGLGQGLGSGVRQDLDQVIQKMSTEIDAKMINLHNGVLTPLCVNVCKMFLSSTLGMLGAFIAYKNIMAYFAIAEQADLVDLKIHGQQIDFFDLQQKKIALLKLEAKRSCLRSQQRKRLCFATVGAVTFAAACSLCSYWIQQENVSLKTN